MPAAISRAHRQGCEIQVFFNNVSRLIYRAYLRVVLCREVPVDQVVEESFGELGTQVMAINVTGVCLDFAVILAA